MFRDFYDNYMSTRRSGYPSDRDDIRHLPNEYEGLVITSDIDKTYLKTRFGSLRSMVRTALESAEEKQSFQGMVPLYKGLRRGVGDEDLHLPLYFLSASPPSMRKVLSERMQLDGITPDGITLKKWFRLIRHGRWEQLRKHVVYKLNALLVNRSVRPVSAKIQEVLIGDDSETDADAYLLYTSILNGTIELDELKAALYALNANDKEREQILQLSSRTDESTVARIYIHCTTKKDPSRLPEAPKELMLGALDSLQIALDCHQHGWMREEEVLLVAQEFRPEQRDHSLEDLRAREYLPQEQFDLWSEKFSGLPTLVEAMNANQDET